MNKRYNFYKLKNDENDWNRRVIPEGRKVKFETDGRIARQDVKKVLSFAYDMAYGEGHHRDHRQGGSHRMFMIH